MVRMAIEYEDGFVEVHFAYGSHEDTAICGADLDGDDQQGSEHGSYDHGFVANVKFVNCEHCLRLVHASKAVRLRKYEKI